MNLQPPPLFARGPAPLVRLAFFVSLAALLMVLDARFRYVETLRSALAVVAYPLQRASMSPVDLFNGVAGFFSSQTSLRRENDALRGRVLQASKDTLTLDALQAELVTCALTLPKVVPDERRKQISFALQGKALEAPKAEE